MNLQSHACYGPWNIVMYFNWTELWKSDFENLTILVLFNSSLDSQYNPRNSFWLLFSLGTYQVQTMQAVMENFQNNPSTVHQLSKRPFHLT